VAVRAWRGPIPLLPERPFIFTQGGQIPNLQKPCQEPQRNLKAASIRREAEASLRRVGVDHLDLYQFDWPDETGTPIEESWGEMVRLIDDGKVRAGAVSNFSVALLERAERSGTSIPCSRHSP